MTFLSIIGNFFIRHFNCHIQQILEEFDDHLLSMCDLVPCFMLNLKTQKAYFYNKAYFYSYIWLCMTTDIVLNTLINLTLYIFNSF